MTEKKNQRRLTPWQQLKNEGLPSEIVAAKLGIEPALPDTPQKRTCHLTLDQINYQIDSDIDCLSPQEVENQIIQKTKLL